MGAKARLSTNRRAASTGGIELNGQRRCRSRHQDRWCNPMGAASFLPDETRPCPDRPPRPFRLRRGPPGRECHRSLERGGGAARADEPATAEPSEETDDRIAADKVQTPATCIEPHHRPPQQPKNEG